MNTDRLFKAASFVGTVLLFAAGIAWFAAQARHFWNAPDGVIFFFAGLFILYVLYLLTKSSFKEWKQ